MENKMFRIDKFFTSNLDGYRIQPSPQVWNGIEDNYLRDHLRKTPFFKRFLPFLALFISGTVAVSFMFLAGNGNYHQPPQENYSGIPVSNENAIESIENDDANKEKTEITTGNELTSTYTNPSTINNTKKREEHLTGEEKDLDSQIENVTGNDQNKLLNTDPGYTKTSSGKTAYHGFDPVIDIVPITRNKLDLPENISNPIQARPASETMPVIHDLTLKDDYLRKANMLLGVHFTPALSFYPGSSSRNNYSFEFTADYTRSRFFVQSGLGLNYQAQDGDYSVRYKSYDSVGFFMNVSSFTISPGNPDSVIFDLVSTNLYDSVEHFVVRQVRNNYLYLQIPLNIGYKLFQYKRLSCTIRTGLIFSLMVYKDEPEIRYPANDIDLIDISKHYPGRLRTNWQFTAGLGFSYQLNKNINLTFEPVFRQYINKIYEPGYNYSDKKPYAIGLRTGIYFNF